MAQKQAGYDLLKIHPGVPRDAFDAMAAKADELKIPFAGHVREAVGLMRALEAKYRSIDHLDGYVEAMVPNPAGSQTFGVNFAAQADESRIPALVKATVAAGTWQVPTEILLVNWLNDENPESMAKWPEMKYVAPETLAKWVAQKQGFSAKFPQADRQKLLALRRRLIKALHDGGVPFALGSDAPQTWNVPGFSAHRELGAIVAAGSDAVPGAQERHRQRRDLLRHGRDDRHRCRWQARRSRPARRQPADRHRQQLADRRRHGQRPLAVEGRHRQAARGR